ncbi:MAG: DnaD domain protein [Psychrobacillus psychrodurans]
MSKYRSVQVSFWQDAFVLDLTPEEKYFYIYLMTNSKASQIGIYELPKRIIETETGYNRETVEKLLKRFMEYNKIQYDDSTNEIFIINWARYNWNNSPKVVSRVIQELGLVKNKDFSKRYIEQALEMNTNKQFSEYGYGIDTVSIDYAYKEKEKEKEKEKKKENNKENEKHSSISDNQNKDFEQSHVVSLDDEFAQVVRFINENIQPITPYIGQTIEYLLKDMPACLVIEALKIAIQTNAKNKFKYAEAILKSWSDQLVKTLDDVKKLNNVSVNKGGKSHEVIGEVNKPTKTYSDGLNF